MPLSPCPHNQGFPLPQAARSPLPAAFLGLGLSFLLLMCPVAVAGEAQGSDAEVPPETLRAPHPTEHASPDTARRPGGAGLRVFVDPVSGELVSRPTASQVRRLQQAIDDLEIDQSVTELHPFALRDGGTGAYVGDRFMTSTVVRRTADGSLVMDCTSDPDHLRHHHPPLAPRSADTPATTRRSDAPVM